MWLKILSTSAEVIAAEKFQITQVKNQSTDADQTKLKIR